MSGHCEHCRDGCEDEPVLDLAGVVWFEHSDEDGRTWLTSDAGIDCSACVERERIVAAIKARVKQCADDWNMPGDLLDYTGPDAAYLDGMLEAAHIAGGDA